MSAVGFVGIGRMGHPIAGHVGGAAGGVNVYDPVPPADGWPAGSTPVASPAELAAVCEIVFLSLPNGDIVAGVVAELAAAGGAVRVVVDTSTIGPAAARAAAAVLAEHGITYVDAPVSGGVAGARAGTLTTMCAAPADVFAEVEPLLASFAAQRFHVGEAAGLGQVAKLANNYVSGTALAATSEAVAFAVANGVDPAVMVDVLNVSTGRTTASSDKFPQQVLTGKYAAGFAAGLMLKDIRLCDAAAKDGESTWHVGPVVLDVWERFVAAEPDADFTRIYPFVEGGG